MIVFLIFFVFLVTVMIITVVVANSVLRKRDVDQMKTLVSGRATPAGVKGETPLMKDKAVNKRDAVAQLVLGSNLTEKLRSYIEQAGLDWDPARTVYLSLLLALLGFNLFWYMIPRGQVIAFIGVIAGAGAPFLYLYQKRKARLMKFEAQFPDALEFVSRAMRSGHAFSVSLEMLHKEYSAPLADEFRRTFDEQNLGLPLEVALERLGTRVPLLDVHFFVSAVLLTVVGFKFWVQPKTALERVIGEVELAQQSVPEPSLAFRDILTKVGNVVPANPTDIGILQKRLLSAGIRSQHALKVLYGIKGILAVFFTISSAGLVFGFQLQSEMSVFQIGAAGFLGWGGPNVVLNRMAIRRQRAIKKGLPNMLDMLVICVESGLGLDQALMQVSKELHTAHPEISDELAVMNLEMRAGKRRTESLHNFGERTDVDDVKKMVSVLIQADRFGTSISQTLRNFSDFMRVQYRMEIEEKAAKIGVKLVFPIFFFILPSLFVVTVGPIIVTVVRDFLPGLNQ